MDVRVAGVDDRVRAVDEKVTMVIDGAQSTLSQSPKNYLTLMWLDGKESRVVIQQTASDVDQVKREQCPSLGHAEQARSVILQETNHDRIFVDGSPHPIPLQTTTLHVVLTTREQPTGSFRAAYSRAGSPLVRCCGFMENVRCSRLSRLTTTNDPADYLLAGSGKTIIWFVTAKLLQPWIPDS
jgi:hypothetical protein